MAKHKNKISRYYTVFKRRLKQINSRKIKRWFKINLRQHPFILAILFFIWFNAVFIRGIFVKRDIKNVLKFHFLIFISWLLLGVLLNSLKDKYKVRWYLRKRFVAFMLLLLPPLGIILLWSGSQFKKITKITLTIIFSLFFIITNVYYNKKYEKLLNKAPFDRIVEMITHPKKKIMLKMQDVKIISRLQLNRIPKKAKVKLAVSEIAARCSPGIVSIKTKDKNGEEFGMGSGFVISEDGIIVTNFHVIESASQVEIKIGENIFKEAYFVKGLPDLDIAILKIDVKNLSALYIGESDSLVNGQFVIVLGNPWGLERSVSSGIVSAIRSKGNIKLIQMTAPVSPGSSGGPVINEYGEVVGITTLASFFLAQNLNFAIPINYLNKIIGEK